MKLNAVSSSTATEGLIFSLFYGRGQRSRLVKGCGESAECLMFYRVFPCLEREQWLLVY